MERCGRGRREVVGGMEEDRRERNERRGENRSLIR